MEFPEVPGLTIQCHLGSGSTGQVYAARRDVDGWACAVKVARDVDDRVRAELIREAGLLGCVRLPHLVVLHEVVELVDGRICLVLDLADGGSVGQVAGQRGHFTPAETVTVLVPVLRTLGELHRRGIVHGDLSAANVLLTRDGRPMLADLGRSRLVGEYPDGLRATVEYLAPEARGTGAATAAGDVYAAGALGWRLLIGQAAPVGLLRRPLLEALPSCPAELAAVIEDCLRGDPAVRPHADEAAERVLAACRATPLPMPLGRADELTHRLRSAAAGGHPVGTGTVPWQPEEPRELGEPAQPGGRHRRTAAPTPAARRGLARLPWLSPYRVGVVGLGVGVCAVVAYGGADRIETLAQRWRPRPPVSMAPAAVAASSTPSIHSSTPSTPSSPSTPRGTETAPPPADAEPSSAASGPVASGAPVPTVSSRPPTRTVAPLETEALGALDALVEARAEAYRRANPAYLSRVYLPGVTWEEADRRDVTALRRAGARYDRLRYALRQPVARCAGDDATASCRVTTRIDTSAYQVVVAGVVRQERPGGAGAALELEMRRTAAGGWRLVSVRPA